MTKVFRRAARHRLPSVITGTHAIIYAQDAEQTRAFFRDVLGFSNVDARDGWLIFKLPPAELGIHPAGTEEAQRGGHEIYFTCDDIDATVAELRAKGVEFLPGVEDGGTGWQPVANETPPKAAQTSRSATGGNRRQPLRSAW